MTFAALVGLTVKEALEHRACKKMGVRTIRQAQVDGHPMVGTRDYRTDRLNVETRTPEGAADVGDRIITAVRRLG